MVALVLLIVVVKPKCQSLTTQLAMNKNSIADGCADGVASGS